MRWRHGMRPIAAEASRWCKRFSRSQLERPLAEADLLPGRRWNPWEIAISPVVDTARIGPLTVGYGDSDDLGLRASAGGFGR